MGNLIRRSCLRSTFPIFGAVPRNEAVMWGMGWGWDDGMMWGMDGDEVMV